MNKTWIPIVFVLCSVLCAFYLNSTNQIISASAHPTEDSSIMTDGSSWISDRLVYNYSDAIGTGSSPRDINEMRATIVASPIHNEQMSGYLYAAYEYYIEDEQAWGIRIEASMDGGVRWKGICHISEPGIRLANPSLAVDPYDGWLYVAYEAQWGSEIERCICVTQIDDPHGMVDPWYYFSIPAGSIRSVLRNRHGVVLDWGNVRHPKIACEYNSWPGNDLFVVYEKVNNVDDVDVIFVRIDVGMVDPEGGTRLLYYCVNDIHRVTLYGMLDWCVNSQPSIAYSHGISIAFRRALDHDSVGTIYVARSLDKGDSWTYIPNVDGLTEDCTNPSIVCTRPSGRGSMLMVAFEHMGNIRYSYSTTYGDHWYVGNILTATDAYEHTPLLTIEGLETTDIGATWGNIHAVYVKRQSGQNHENIKYTYTHMTTPNEWANPQTVNDHPVPLPSNFGLGITANNRSGTYYPCVVWTDIRDVDEDVFSSTLGTTYTFEAALENGEPVQFDVMNVFGRDLGAYCRNQLTPVTVEWADGSLHHIDVAPEQTINLSARYIWIDWSDGGDPGRDIIAGSDPHQTHLVAHFRIQHMFNLRMLPHTPLAGTLDPPPDVYWIDLGEEVVVEALPNRWEFNCWIHNTVNVSVSSKYSVHMNTGHNLTAIFTLNLSTVPIDWLLPPESETSKGWSKGNVSDVYLDREGFLEGRRVGYSKEFSGMMTVYFTVLRFSNDSTAEVFYDDEVKTMKEEGGYIDVSIPCVFAVMYDWDTEQHGISLGITENIVYKVEVNNTCTMEDATDELIEFTDLQMHVIPEFTPFLATLLLIATTILSAVLVRKKLKPICN